MNRRVILAIWMVTVLTALTNCAPTAVFKSLDTNITGEQQILKGELTKPSGDGPFPAVVLLHGCSGPIERDFGWISKLRRWGYVSLMAIVFEQEENRTFVRLGRA